MSAERPPEVTPAPVVSPSQTEAQYDQMMSGLLRRLDAHASMVNRDQGTSPPPPTMATVGSEMREEIRGEPHKRIAQLVQDFEWSFRDLRECAGEKLRAYSEEVAWTISGSRVRVAPEMVARVYRNGRCCEEYVKQFIKEKELEGNHLGSEMLLLAMMIDKAVQESPAEWINYQTTEVAFRRLHGIERAFAQVSQQSDWKAPRGAKSWKTGVQYAVLDEIDARKLSEGGVITESLEKEVRDRLQQKALLQKSLSKLGPHEEAARGE